ncbi:hypothetical protein LVJ94_37165 [Pendulispora rubella]|uniref:Lipoprotein n=1 Tax=Pendulispora rubella TaxID=2741070 RepID=A0ABZ2KYZ1_9BACT
MKARFSFLLVLLVTACSSDQPDGSYDALFNTPSSTNNTPNSIRGLWVAHVARNENDGVDADIDARMFVSESSVMLACRCRYPDNTVLTAGVTVGAHILDADTELITTNDAENAPASGNHTCRIVVKAGTLGYHIRGRELEFQGDGLPYPQFATSKYVPPFAKASD